MRQMKTPFTPFILFVLLCCSFYAHAQLTVNVNRIYVYGWPTNHFMFDIAESTLPAISTPTGIDTPGYKVFIDFGDGDYRIFRYDTGAVIPIITHNYPQNAARYKPKVRVTKVYTADDDPLAETRLDLDPVPWEIYPVSPLPIDMGDSLVRIEAVTEPVPGDSITLIVSYTDTLSTAGIITYKWGHNLIFGSIDFYNGESLASPMPVVGMAGPDSISWSYRGMAPGEVRNVFITFQTADFSPTVNPIGDSISAEARYLEHGQEGLDTAEYMFRIYPSHDPNSKVVEPQVFFKNQQNLTYSIHFQNEGMGPARHIAVIDEIDPRLDFDSFQMQYVRMGQGEAKDEDLYPGFVGFKYRMKKDPGSRTISWEFDPVYLPGTKDPNGYLGDVMTSGEIIYTIRTECPMDTSMIIPNHAEVFFDGHSLLTDTTYARRACCDVFIPNNESYAKIDLVEQVKQQTGMEIIPESIRLLEVRSLSQRVPNRPKVKFRRPPYLYYYAREYSGLDAVAFFACDPSQRCDTFVVNLCVRMGEFEDQYRCEGGPCYATNPNPNPNPLQVLEEPMIVVFPNPFDEVVYLDYRQTEVPIHRLELIDMMGNKLMEIPVQEYGKSEVDVSALHRGLYFIRINEIWLQKLVK